MSRSRDSIARQTLIYGAGIGLNRLAGFLMLPIYTSFLTPSDYGVLELLSTTVELIGTIAGVGLISSVFKFHAEFDEPADKREVVSTAGISILGLSLLASVSGFLAAEPLTALVFPDGEAIPLYFQLFFVTHLFRQAELTPLLYLRIQQRPVLFVSMSLMKLVLMLGLNIYFVVGRGMGLWGVLVGNAVATGVSATILSIYLARAVGFHFSRQKFRKMVIFGYPLVFWFLGSFVFVFSDRYFLNHFATAAAVGTYALAYRFVSILSAIGYQPFQTVWDPKRYEIAREENPGPKFRAAFTYLNLGFAFLALGLGLFTREVLVLMARNPEFFEAYRVVPILVAAQIFYHWAAYANLGLMMNDRTPILAWVAGIGSFVVVALNLLLIPRYGAMGAAVATLIAYSGRFVAIWLLAQREVRLEYDWPAILKLYALVSAAVGAKLLWGPETLLPAIGFGAAVALVAVALAWTLVLREEERAGVRRTIGSRLGRTRA